MDKQQQQQEDADQKKLETREIMQLSLSVLMTNREWNWSNKGSSEAAAGAPVNLCGIAVCGTATRDVERWEVGPQCLLGAIN